MPQYKTTSLSQFGHPEMVVDVSQEYASSVKWHFSYLESCVRDGTVFKPGETLKIGWMIVKLVARQDGTIEFWEPSFEQMPIKWRLGLNRTFQDLMVQSEICKKLNTEPSFPSILDVGLLSDALIDGRFEFLMSRDVSSEKECGWCFVELDYNDLSISYCSLFEIAVNRPMVIPFLAIPQICSVKFLKDGFVVSYSGIDISMYEKEFFQKVGNSAYFAHKPHQLN